VLKLMAMHHRSAAGWPRLAGWLLALSFSSSLWGQGLLSPRPEGAGGSEGREAEDEIETDRDSFTPASSLVGEQRWVVESAYSFIDNRRVAETHSLPELLVRYGWRERVELRFGTNYEVGGAGNPTSANVPDDLAEKEGLEEEANVSYGLKLGISRQQGWRPQTAIILQGFTPTAGEVTNTDLIVAGVSGWTFANRWTWDNAIRFGTGSNEEDHFNLWEPSTVLKVPLGERWKAHVEYFGVFSDKRERETVQHFFSSGAHYLITPDWEVGSRSGWGLNEQAPNYFINLGLGYRF
jgi:hypothetical protein